jgi:integrase
MPPAKHLPRYVSISKTGVYQYRRRVPDTLRATIGRREIKESLGKDYAAMLKRHAALEASVTKLFAQKPHRNSNVRIKVMSKLREYGIETQALAIAASAATEGVDPDNMDDTLIALDAALAELEGDPEVPPELIQGVSAGKLPITLETALDDYCARRIAAVPHRKKLTEQAIARHKALLVRILGKADVCHRPLYRIKRADARTVRDHLLQEAAPSTARRVLNDISAAVNHAVMEHDLEMANPFARAGVQNAQHNRAQRHPLDPHDMELLAPIMRTDDDLGLIWWALRDTGARQGEILGLRGCDIDEGRGFIAIKPYDGHELKTENSERDIPIPEALGTALAAKKGDDPKAPIFPAYKRERGSDACSQALMKRLRKAIKDPKKSVYSLRHRLKDLLRDTDCPENLQREIMGHSDQSSAANYGHGSSLERKRAALEKVWAKSHGANGI